MRYGLLGAGLSAVLAIGATVATAQAGSEYDPASSDQVVADLAVLDDDAIAEARAEYQVRASRYEVRGEVASITIDVDGEPIEHTTGAERVSEALLEAGIVVDELDVVSVPLGDRVTDGMEISIDRRSVGEVREVETDEFETVEQEDSSMLVGERTVAVEGVDGVTVSIYREVSGDAVEAERELVARSVLSERVDEVVKVGTRQPAPRVASGSGGGSSSGSSGGSSNPTGNRAIGQELAADRGWSGEEWVCLDNLWQRESNWNHRAQNPSSGAYGIPQSLPGNKMASVGSDWQTNPSTQITWGLNYIAGRYGTPCGAWSHSQQRGWY